MVSRDIVKSHTVPEAKRQRCRAHHWRKGIRMDVVVRSRKKRGAYKYVFFFSVGIHKTAT